MCIRDRRWAQAAFPPSPARGRSAGTCSSDSRVLWPSRGGSPGAGPRGPGPRTCRTTSVSPHCTCAVGPGPVSRWPSPAPS
eukprot:15458583-Alexandrium_andersonii.AAC.1